MRRLWQSWVFQAKGAGLAGATRLLPAYLVVGPDELKRKQTVTRLRAHVEGPFADFNLEELVASADMEPVGVL